MDLNLDENENLKARIKQLEHGTFSLQVSMW